MTKRAIDVYQTGKTIKRLCEERGITATDIMRKLNLNSPDLVYKWFRGERMPSVDNLVLLSDYLGVSIDELIVSRALDK